MPASVSGSAHIRRRMRRRARAVLAPLGAGIGDDGLLKVTRVLKIPDGILKQSWFRLLDQIELLLRVQDIDLDRQ